MHLRMTDQLPASPELRVSLSFRFYGCTFRSIGETVPHMASLYSSVKTMSQAWNPVI